MENYRSTLKTVGIWFIILGLIDSGYMVYCISNDISYSSSFNIFAVIGGILLYRGSLKTAVVIRWFSAFFLSAMTGVLLFSPLFIPLGLVETEFRINPFLSAGSLAIGICLLNFLFWAYRRLGSDDILNAMEQQEIKFNFWWFKPKVGFIVGCCLALLLAILLNFAQRGAAAEMAKIEAQKKIGPGYNFVVTSMSMGSSYNKTWYRATVAAYNEKEIKSVAVEWNK